VANDQVTFIDHGTLGALIRIQAQGNKAADSSANSASQYME